jgi:hypothetical protein
MDLRVASNLASFSASGCSSPGVTPATRLFPLRLSMRSRCAPVPASSGCAGDGSSSCPESRVLWRLWRWCLGSPLGSALPVTPPGAVTGFPSLCTFRLCLGVETSGRPESSLLWRRLMVPRVASVPAPSGLPSLRPQVSPSPASTAGSMMTSRFSSNFASSAEPRMNLRVQSGLSQSRLTLDAFSQSHSGFHLPASRPVYLRFQPHPASSCQAGTVFPTRI